MGGAGGVRGDQCSTEGQNAAGEVHGHTVSEGHKGAPNNRAMVKSLAGTCSEQWLGRNDLLE